MKPVFEILPEAIFFQQTNLICEISLNSLSYVFENDIEKKFYGLYFFNFNKNEDIASQLKDIFRLESLLSRNYKKVFISYSGEESALLPEELYKPGSNDVILNTLYGDLNDSTILTDLVADKKIYNVYRMPASIHKVINDQFPLAAFNHQYSLLIKEDIKKTDLFKTIFYPDTFVVIVKKAGELQLIHTYTYKTNTDVVYHLENISQQFHIGDVALNMGGIISPGSDLDKELRHYFDSITFDELPHAYQYSDKLMEVPAHYFSHLFALALCV